MTQISKQVLVAIFICGCGSDPVSYSAPISLNDKLQSGDVELDGTMSFEKGITTESGNPWGVFIADTQEALGGNPGDMELTSLVLLLTTDSVNVLALNEVFDGTVDVQFNMNDTNNFYDVGSGIINADTVGRELALDPSFDYSSMGPVDIEKLMSGSFKVVLAGPAEADFASIDADADFQLTLTFTSFE